MKNVLLFVGLTAISILITSAGIELGWNPVNILLTNMLAGAILGFVKGNYFHD